MPLHLWESTPCNKYMKSMANAAGLDTTRKKLTKHSVWKTTVRKLQEQGILNSDVAGITSHCNVQSLQQYAEMDAEMEQENHAQISKVLRSGHQCAVARPPPHDCNPNIQATLPYNFSNCIVFFDNTQASSTSTQWGRGGGGGGGGGGEMGHFTHCCRA